MGIGDEIMAAGRAMAMAKRIGRPVRIVNTEGLTRWHEVWEGNPSITMDERAPVLLDGPGARAYIKKPFTAEGHGYTEWRARDERGRIYLTEGELQLGHLVAEQLGRFVVIEPHIKAGANPNKRWNRWQEVVEAAPDIRFVQLGPAGVERLEGVVSVPTSSFRAACGVLAHAAAIVAPEGGLHHAAAALGVRAVVIFGGSPSAQATGYDSHVNLGGDDPCGRWKPCRHCAAKMAEITPDLVVKSLQSILERPAP
jgi:hypothetical protein